MWPGWERMLAVHLDRAGGAAERSGPAPASIHFLSPSITAHCLPSTDSASFAELTQVCLGRKLFFFLYATASLSVQKGTKTGQHKRRGESAQLRVGAGTCKGEGGWQRPSCSAEPQISSEISCDCAPAGVTWSVHTDRLCFQCLWNSSYP